MKKKYTLQDLGCAHCAAKMEDRIKQLDGIEEAVISYPNKLLVVTAEDPDSHISQIQKICSSIESQVKVLPRAVHESVHAEHCHEHSHEHHHDHCGCHEHHHEHEHHEEPAHHHNEAAHGEKEKSGVIRLAAGIVLAVIAYIAGFAIDNDNITLILYLIAYLFLAKDIILTAIHNIGKGQIFDENFLMVIATLGAFIIEEYPEALGVILFYRIGEAFEDYAVEKSRASIMETVNMRPETVLQVHGDHTHEIPAEDAVPGMVILVRPGDRIPLDGIITEGSTQIDTSALTGEPVPVTASEGDSVLSGCLNQDRRNQASGNKRSGRIHGKPRYGVYGKCRSKQAENGTFYYEIFACIYSFRCSYCSCNRHHSFSCKRKLGTLDLYRLHIPCYQLSMRPRFKCSAFFLLGHRTRFQTGNLI